MNKDLRTEAGRELLTKKLLVEKKSKTVVAKELEISINLLNKLISEHKIDMKADKELDEDKLKSLWYETNHTFSEMAEILGTNQAKVFRTVRKLGLTDREVKRDRKQIAISYEEVYELYVNKRLTYKEIADIMGASVASIHRRIKEYGLERETLAKAV